jgi:hypothetical protein
VLVNAQGIVAAHGNLAEMLAKLAETNRHQAEVAK